MLIDLPRQFNYDQCMPEPGAEGQATQPPETGKGPENAERRAAKRHDVKVAANTVLAGMVPDRPNDAELDHIFNNPNLLKVFSARHLGESKREDMAKLKTDFPDGQNGEGKRKGNPLYVKLEDGR